MVSDGLIHLPFHITEKRRLTADTLKPKALYSLKTALGDNYPFSNVSFDVSEMTTQ